MELEGARTLVAGATGELGGQLARRLRGAGATVSVAGRDEERLASVAEELDARAFRFDARDFASCEAAVTGAADALGGLDLLVIATGEVGFGAATSLDMAAATRLFEVNVLGPMALVRAALARMDDAGTVVGLSAIVADYPTADMAAYSASKAALSAYMAAVRRERRREGLRVLDVRPQHMETGFSDRAVAGEAPDLPQPLDPDEVVDTILGAMRDERREVAFDLRARSLVVN